MKFKCENIGMISSADIEINKISVIAGLNSTGKSTIGKAFYCMFNGFSDIEKSIERSLKDSLYQQVSAIWNLGWDLSESSAYTRNQIRKCVEELCANKKNVSLELVKQIFSQNFPLELLKNISDESYRKVYDVIKIPDDALKMMIIQRMYNIEFQDQLQNAFFPDKESFISLIIKNVDTRVNIRQNKILEIKNLINIKMKAFYIDNPFIIDSISPFLLPPFFEEKNYRQVLLDAIKPRPNRRELQSIVDEYLTNEKIKNIESKLSSVSNGNLVLNDKKSVVYHLNDKNVDLSLSNVSAGLKTFVIIKALLKNGALKENGVLILDEPEIHLHPEWQKKFAEIIVLIQKTFNKHILISSHSPYFINALDVYERKYGINEECRFYLTIPDGEANKVEDVSKNLEPIYKLLFEPMQALENERASLS